MMLPVCSHVFTRCECDAMRYTDQSACVSKIAVTWEGRESECSRGCTVEWCVCVCMCVSPMLCLPHSLVALPLTLSLSAFFASPTFRFTPIPSIHCKREALVRWENSRSLVTCLHYLLLLNRQYTLHQTYTSSHPTQCRSSADPAHPQAIITTRRTAAALTTATITADHLQVVVRCLAHPLLSCPSLLTPHLRAIIPTT